MNWKTTLFGGIGFLLPVLNMLVPIVPMPWGPLIGGVSGALAFYFAKDKNVTGGATPSK